MRFEDGNTVVEVGGAGADRIEASTSVSFDWNPPRAIPTNGSGATGFGMRRTSHRAVSRVKPAAS